MIKPEGEKEEKKKKKKGKKEEEEKKKKKSEKEGEEEGKKKKGKKEGEEEEKKGGVPGGNIGFGISIFSSGGGKGNAVLGVAINSHGSTYGTASAGIVYDANGDAVAAASVGAGAHVSGHVAGGATAGVASHTSTEAAAVATAGKGKNADTIALANASAGSAENTSTVTIATASSGESKDTDDTSVAKKGSGSGSAQAGAGGGKPGEHEGADTSDPTGGLQIPGVSKAETAKAVADAARIDAELQKASAAQKDLLAYLAQQSDGLEYEVPDPQWVLTFMTATKGLSEADIKFLQQQQWVPADKITPEELRKQIDDRLKNRNKPQGTAKKPGGQHETGKDEPAPKDVKPDDKGSSGDPKKTEKKITAASLDEPATTDPKKKETDKEAALRLYKRAKEFDWKHMKAVGEFHYGKEGKTYGQVSGAFYFKGDKGVGFTADVAGIMTKGDKGDVLEVRACSIIVTSDARVISGSALVGKSVEFQR